MNLNLTSTLDSGHGHTVVYLLSTYINKPILDNIGGIFFQCRVTANSNFGTPWNQTKSGIKKSPDRF